MEPTAEELEAIRAKVRAGVLRYDAPERTWGGMGKGRPCDACGGPIEKVEVEYELDFDGGKTTLRLHVPCCIAWRDAATTVRARLAEI
jgi:hypothetical protein